MPENKYLVRGDHPSVLHSGRTVVPGDTLPASAVNAKDEDSSDLQLLADGVLTDTSKEKTS